MVVEFSHVGKTSRDVGDKAELGCVGVGSAKRLMFSSGRSVQSAGVGAGAGWQRDGGSRGAASPPPQSPRLAAAVSAGVGVGGAVRRTDAAAPMLSSGYTYGVSISPPYAQHSVGATPMSSRRRRVASAGGSGSVTGLPPWQLGFKGTAAGRYPPPLGGGRPGTAAPLGGGPYSGEGLEGGFSYSSSAYLPAARDELQSGYEYSGYSGGTDGAGGSWRQRPAAHPDQAVSPERRMAHLHRVDVTRNESISRLSARRQEREGLQMASRQAMVEVLPAAPAASGSFLDSAAQLSMFLDRPQTAGVGTGSGGYMSASGSGTMSPQQHFTARPTAGRYRGTVKPVVRVMPLVPSTLKPRAVVSALPNGGRSR